MNRRRTQALSTLLVALLFPVAVRAETPSAADILRSAREASQRQQSSLRARLRDEDGNKTPFTISLDRGTLNYDFKNPDQRIQLVIGDDGAELRESLDGSMRTVNGSAYARKVRGTPITYEDLAMSPLYWSGARLLGEATEKTRKCWKIEVPAPKEKSQYGAARLWIDQETRGAVKIEIYGKDGKRVKEFFATSVQTINGKWTLKTMRIKSYDPAANGRAELMYLDVLDQAP